VQQFFTELLEIFLFHHAEGIDQVGEIGEQGSRSILGYSDLSWS
jgi:hypothetical protein